MQILIKKLFNLQNLQFLILMLYVALMVTSAYANGSPLEPINKALTSNTKTIMEIAKTIMIIYFIIGVLYYVAKKGQASAVMTILLPLMGTALVFGADKIFNWAKSFIN